MLFFRTRGRQRRATIAVRLCVCKKSEGNAQVAVEAITVIIGSGSEVIDHDDGGDAFEGSGARIGLVLCGALVDAQEQHVSDPPAFSSLGCCAVRRLIVCYRS